jgi:hypothetical protein
MTTTHQPARTFL